MNNDDDKKRAEKEIEKETGLELLHSDQDWMIAFEKWIRNLIASDMSRLIHLLYRLDVDEIKLKEKLKANQQADSAKVIATMIMERQLLKIKTRQAYKPGNANADDFEKW